MNTTARQPPQLEVDADSFLPALDRGALDTCLHYLRRADAGGGRDAALNCRLAEALFHRGRPDEALECVRRAFATAPADPEMLRLCAWLFSNCECHEEAAAAYARLLELCPDWVEGHRHASGSLAAAGRLDEAVAQAKRACEIDPQNPEFALHAAVLLLAAERRPEGAAFALRAADLAQRDTRLVVDAAEVLLRCERVEEAAALLGRAAGITREPRLLRVLSSAEMLCGRPEAALAAVEQALAGEPDNPEYQLHRGHLLWQLGDIGGAAQAFERVAALDPDNREAKRARLSLYLAAGLTTEATATGGELLHRFPDDRPTAEAVLHLLNHRLDTIDGEYVVLGTRDGDGVRAPLPDPGVLDRLRSQRRVIRALIIRETRTRFADSRLGYGWALIEPIAHIALLSATFAVLMDGRPPIGTHFFVFYYTGLIPYHFFVHASTGMSHAIIGNAPLLQLPPVTTFDVIAARGLLEVMTDVVVAVLLLAGFLAIGLSAMPADFWGPAIALIVTAALGCGVGFFNAVLTVIWRSWEKVFTQLTRVLYFISGIFYVPGMMPDWARDLLAWNPLLHSIDWFRAGFFGNYQPHWLDQSYLVVVAIVSLLAGLALHRLLRRKLSAPL